LTQKQARRYFGTDGIRGRVGQAPISPDWIVKLGWAVGSVLGREGHGKVLIGKDTRISGYMLESALEAGLSAAGMDTHLLGPMPTPAIAYLTRTLRARAGIVISASHNPYYDNGIKFFNTDGSKLSDELETLIEDQLERTLITVDARALGKAVRVVDAPGRYIEFCKSSFPSGFTLKGWKIVLDCANGATYHIAPSVFRELGAEVIELAVKPDGFNINENCGSTYPQSLIQTVLNEQADVGIAFDGDGDRVIMVDAQGEIVDGDELLFIIAQWYQSQERLKGGVVGTVMSNLGLEHAFLAHNIPFLRASVGDRYVLAALKQNNWTLGGESSGHLICLDANTTGDGIVSALRVLTAMHISGRTLTELKSGMKKYPQTMINVPCDKHTDLNDPAVIHAVKAAELRLKDTGRVLLRRSGTESVIRVMVEGQDAVLVQEVSHTLAEAVQNSRQLA